MEESSTYRAIVRRGGEQTARRILLSGGEGKFGAPDAAARAVIDSITDLAQLEELAIRVVNTDSWQDLLGRQTPKRNRKPRS